jgi:hypothetical protein
MGATKNTPFYQRRKFLRFTLFGASKANFSHVCSSAIFGAFGI